METGLLHFNKHLTTTLIFSLSLAILYPSIFLLSVYWPWVSLPTLPFPSHSHTCVTRSPISPSHHTLWQATDRLTLPPVALHIIRAALVHSQTRGQWLWKPSPAQAAFLWAALLSGLPNTLSCLGSQKKTFPMSGASLQGPTGGSCWSISVTAVWSKRKRQKEQKSRQWWWLTGGDYGGFFFFCCVF